MPSIFIPEKNRFSQTPLHNISFQQHSNIDNRSINQKEFVSKHWQHCWKVCHMIRGSDIISDDLDLDRSSDEQERRQLVERPIACRVQTRELLVQVLCHLENEQFLISFPISFSIWTIEHVEFWTWRARRRSRRTQEMPSPSWREYFVSTFFVIRNVWNQKLLQ